MNQQEKQKRNNLTGDQKRAVLVYLLKKSQGKRKLPNGVVEEASAEFQISARSVSKIWAVGRNAAADQAIDLMKQLSPPKKGRVGRKKMDLPLNTIRNLPYKKRRTVRCLAKHIGVSKTVVQNAIKSGEIKRHSNAIKPALTDANKITRLRHCLSQIIPETINDDPLFNGFYDVIMVDEKWFSIAEINQKMLLLPDEEPPHRTCKSKRFLTKVMFLSAIARPRFDPETGDCVFDGKIGIWPFIERVEARRNSANRPRGTIELKPIDVDRDAYREMLMDNVLPAILQKFPDLLSTIKIQQDNARPHVLPDDLDFYEAAQSQGIDVRIVNQAPNSPDQNINDLGFFRAIDSLQQEQKANSIEELIGIVQAAYAEYCPVLLNKVWITYQQCMIETMKVAGCNKYKMPHMKKNRLIRQGLLSNSLHLPLELVARTRILIEQGGI